MKKDGQITQDQERRERRKKKSFSCSDCCQCLLEHVQAMKAYNDSGGTVPLFLNLGTRTGLVAHFWPRLPYSRYPVGGRSRQQSNLHRCAAAILPASRNIPYCTVSPSRRIGSSDK